MGGINCALPDRMSSAGLFLSLGAWALFCQQSACLPCHNIYRLVFHIITSHGPPVTHTHIHTETCQKSFTHSDVGGVPLTFGHDRVGK